MCVCMTTIGKVTSLPKVLVRVIGNVTLWVVKSYLNSVFDHGGILILDSTHRDLNVVKTSSLIRFYLSRSSMRHLLMVY